MKFHSQFVFFGVFILFLWTFPLQAQERFEHDHGKRHDSLHKIEHAFEQGKLTFDQKMLYKFYALQTPRKLPAQFQPQHSLPIKCGTPIIMEFHNNRNQLSAAAVQQIESMIAPTRQAVETYQSNSGFLIHYETSGTNAVPDEDLNQNNIPDYVEHVAAAADSSYRHEVLRLGYSNPIPNGQTYDIEILDLGFYGQTYITGTTTTIQIENDFIGFPPNTDPEGDVAGAVKVTIAHELKHAIQYAATEWSGETDSWAEMDATLMEEVVYDPVNDYYNYLRNSDSIFNSPSSSFYPGSYYHVSWAIFFEEKYGPDFWPGVWDIIVANPDIHMVDAMSEQLGSPEAFEKAFVESQLWHFTSGPQNSLPSYGFEEREFYPHPDISFRLTGSDSLNNIISLPGFSASYIEFHPGLPREGFLSLDLTFTNALTEVGLIAQFENGSYKSKISLAGDVKTGLKSIETNWQWNNIIEVGIIVSNSDETTPTDFSLKVYPNIPERITLKQNYPNPFGESTTIEFSLTEPSEVKLKVYDVTGRLIRTLQNTTLPAGYYEVTFDGSRLASGIYFYQLITDEQSLVEKMTLIK